MYISSSGWIADERMLFDAPNSTAATPACPQCKPTENVDGCLMFPFATDRPIKNPRISKPGFATNLCDLSSGCADRAEELPQPALAFASSLGRDGGI